MEKIKRVRSFMLLATVPASAGIGSSNPKGYLVGGIIALLIMGYLVCTLIWPEKF